MRTFYTLLYITSRRSYLWDFTSFCCFCCYYKNSEWCVSFSDSVTRCFLFPLDMNWMIAVLLRMRQNQRAYHNNTCLFFPSVRPFLWRVNGIPFDRSSFTVHQMTGRCHYKAARQNPTNYTLFPPYMTRFSCSVISKNIINRRYFLFCRAIKGVNLFKHLWRIKMTLNCNPKKNPNNF